MVAKPKKKYRTAREYDTDQMASYGDRRRKKLDAHLKSENAHLRKVMQAARALIYAWHEGRNDPERYLVDMEAALNLHGGLEDGPGLNLPNAIQKPKLAGSGWTWEDYNQRLIKEELDRLEAQKKLDGWKPFEEDEWKRG